MERDIITASLNMYANMNTLQQPIPQMGGNIFPAPGNHPAVAVAAIHQIMQQQMKNTLTAPIPLPQTSPMSMSPVPPIGGPDFNQQLLFQNQAAAAAAAASNKQMRLSPLPAGNCLNLNNCTNGRELSSYDVNWNLRKNLRENDVIEGRPLKSLQTNTSQNLPKETDFLFCFSFSSFFQMFFLC